jgi:hypothetical protein
MSSDAHNEGAKARDIEVARLHPGTPRRHVRATLPARVVLRDVEKSEGEHQLKLIGDSYLTAVVTEGKILFYSGAEPVWSAGSIAVTRVVDVETAHEFTYTPPRVNPTLRLKIEEGTSTLDVDLEVFTLDETGLQEAADVSADVSWWKAATAH